MWGVWGGETPFKSHGEVRMGRMGSCGTDADIRMSGGATEAGLKRELGLTISVW